MNIYIPVNGGIISSFVGDFDDKSIPVINFQCWSGKHSVDSDGGVGFAQPLHWCCLKLHIHQTDMFKKKKKYHTHTCIYQ